MGFFDFLSSKPKEPWKPLDKELRTFFEQNLLFLRDSFPYYDLKNSAVLVPKFQQFPIKWNGDEETAQNVLKILCNHMQIDISMIELRYFRVQGLTLGDESDYIVVDSGPEGPPAGMFEQKAENSYLISISSEILAKPDYLIATMSHELCHLKLLGDLKLEVNDEMLTDLCTVFFGIGVFNANTAFNFTKDSEFWGWSTLGYLMLEEWAYALALVAFMRDEDNPEWAKYLNAHIKSDFDKSLKYLRDFQDEIFTVDDQDE